ncbi:hypothetical protein HHK36_012584 [Tetracentron sinense]|uniref:Uncharacterized protein n=1 Tax=Tetracentron sinense TaxID=13715 RepID=A0A835DFM0_TETSI|nr:hypothetical protein HHK36_012584 [Tetracentron sinense]
MYANLLVSSSSYSRGHALGDLEGQDGHNIPMQLMTSTSGGMGANGATCYLPKDVSNQHIAVAAERNGNHPIAPPLPHWVHCQQTFHNRVNFHSESSTVRSARDIPEGVCLPLGSVQDVKGVFQYQRDILCNNSGMANDFIATDSFVEMDASKAKSSVHMLNFNNRDASINPSRVLCFHQNKMLDGENCNVPGKFLQHNHTSRKQESIEDKCNVSQSHSTVTVAVPGFPSRPCNSVSRQRATETDRGFGHYLLHEQMLNEPLEEMMGKLMEVNLTAATQLLESKGLYVIPMDLAEGLV